MIMWNNKPPHSCWTTIFRIRTTVWIFPTVMTTGMIYLTFLLLLYMVTEATRSVAVALIQPVVCKHNEGPLIYLLFSVFATVNFISNHLHLLSLIHLMPFFPTCLSLPGLSLTLPLLLFCLGCFSLWINRASEGVHLLEETVKERKMLTFSSHPFSFRFLPLIQVWVAVATAWARRSRRLSTHPLPPTPPGGHQDIP